MASFFRRIAENWKLKLLALSIAVLLWVLVSAEQVTTNWIPLPLDVQVEDGRFQAVSPEPTVVEVRFQGTGRDLLDVAVGRPPLRLTIPEVTNPEGAQYDINPRMVMLSGQTAVSALDVRPTSVRVNFARVEARQVPVRPRLADDLGPDWAIVDSIVVRPAQMRVSGNASLLASLTVLQTVPIELGRSDTVFERTVAIDTTGLRGLQLGAPTVNLSGRIDRVVQRIVQNVPVDVGPGVSVSPAEVVVRLRGPERSVRAISPASLRVAVSISEIPRQIPEEGIAVPLRVDGLSPGIEATLEPAEVRLLPPDDAAAADPAASRSRDTPATRLARAVRGG